MKNFTKKDFNPIRTNPQIWAESDQLIDKPLWWQKRNLMYTSTGYGRKIPTSKMIRFEGRLHRIYCCIFSNCGTTYIVSKKQWIIIN